MEVNSKSLYPFLVNTEVLREGHCESEVFEVRWLIYGISCFLVLGSAVAVAVVFLLYSYGRGLPEYEQLAHYKPPVVTRVHGGDGRLSLIHI